MQRISLTPELDLSRIVYGLWRITDDTDASVRHIRAKIDACLSVGITTMDQADIYGGYTAEAVFGTALAADPGLRHKLQIVSKCDIVAPVGKYADRRVKYYDTSAAHITASVEASLGAMHTDYLDLLLIHRPDPLMDHHETGAALDALVQSGKVRAVGVSNFRPWDWSLLQSAMKTPLATNQIEISLIENSAMTNGDLAHLQRQGIPPMAWSPLGGGSLFSGDNMNLWHTLTRIANEQGVDVAAVAIAWLLKHPARIIPVMGTNTIGRIPLLADAFKVELDRETWFELYSAANGQEVA